MRKHLKKKKSIEHSYHVQYLAADKIKTDQFNFQNTVARCLNNYLRALKEEVRNPVQSVFRAAWFYNEALNILVNQKDMQKLSPQIL